MLRNLSFSPQGLIKCADFIHQQVRTTFVLKRKHDPLLHKQNARPKKLRAKHFLYELVEDTLTKRKPDLEVVLKTFVDGVGDKGDIVALRPNFVYNNLILPGLATYKTAESVAQHAKTEVEKVTVLHSSPHAQRTVNMIERLTLGVVMNKDQPWVIEPWHIKACLRKSGYYCTEDCIQIPEEPIEGPDLNKQGKEFYCTITINNLEKARLRCRIHHWSTEPSERLPYQVEHWKVPAEPLFGSPTSDSTNNQNSLNEQK